MSSLRQSLRRLLGHKGTVDHPVAEAATFILKYDDLHVGTLTLQGKEWIFEYDERFKQQSRLRPIVEFPDKNRSYRSHDLWPFFAMRIPSLQQSAVLEIVKAESIDSTDEVELLRRFGRQTLANPFELEAA